MPASASVIDSVIRQRAARNERTVAWARFAFIAIIITLDALAFARLIPFTQVPPTATTLLLDGLFLAFAGAVLVAHRRQVPFHRLQYAVILLDYAIVALILAFDPTVPHEGQLGYWIPMVAALFLYLLNLLRFSEPGTLFAAALSLALLLGTSLGVHDGDLTEVLPVAIALLMFLWIGHSVTRSHRAMMAEANAKLMMERYLPSQLVTELHNRTVALEPGGRAQEVTVLFADIRAFTTLSESMNAAEVVALLNDYLSMMTEIIFAHGGTIDKFIGDAIMTVFGAPVRAEDDAVRAVRTARAMVQAMDAFNRTHAGLDRPLEIGVGLHTGEVIAGNIGSEKRLDYTVIGDNVNLASRIEGLTGHYGCPILISQATRDGLREVEGAAGLVLREIDLVVVKGRSGEVRIHEVMPSDSEEAVHRSRAVREAFERGLALYRSRRFEEALAEFRRLDADGPSRRFAARCERFLAQPPEDGWTGATRMDAKS